MNYFYFTEWRCCSQIAGFVPPENWIEKVLQLWYSMLGVVCTVLTKIDQINSIGFADLIEIIWVIDLKIFRFDNFIWLTVGRVRCVVLIGTNLI